MNDPFDLGHFLSPAMQVLAGGDKTRFRFVRDGARTADKVITRYAAVPSLADPRALLVLDTSPAAWRTALEPHAQGAASGSARFVARLLRVASLFGLGAGLFRDRVALVTTGRETESPLHRFLAETLDIEDFHANLRLAPGRPNSKPVVQVVSRSGEVLAFAKFGWESLTKRLIRSEANTLRTLSREVHDSPIHVPDVLHSGEWNGLETLIVAPLKGMGRTPWRSEDEVVDAEIALARIAPGGHARLSDSAFWERIRGDVSRLANLLEPAAAQVMVSATDWLEREWGDSDLWLGRSHGDWIPPNISIRRDGGFNVWDWERSEADVPLGVDTLQFILFDEMRNSPISADLVRRVDLRGRRALSAQALEPDLVRLLAPLSLLRSLLWFGEAIEAKRGGAEDSQFAAALNAFLEEYRNAGAPERNAVEANRPAASVIPLPPRANAFEMKVSTHEN